MHRLQRLQEGLAVGPRQWGYEHVIPSGGPARAGWRLRTSWCRCVSRSQGGTARPERPCLGPARAWSARRRRGANPRECSARQIVTKRRRTPAWVRHLRPPTCPERTSGLEKRPLPCRAGGSANHEKHSMPTTSCSTSSTSKLKDSRLNSRKVVNVLSDVLATVLAAVAARRACSILRQLAPSCDLAEPAAACR